jgi:tRNA pseudouridine55 synthase
MKDNRVVPYYKRIGETPKEAIARLRQAKPDLATETLSYAGRLDPLADGLLLVLVGDANQERESYLALEKAYRFTVLFGFSTDTYDIAGRLAEMSNKRVDTMALIKAVTALPGQWEEPYPPFSSKPVLGRPLFAWAREGRLDEITIPRHRVEVKKASLLRIGAIAGSELDALVRDRISALSGDFRQREILACWERNLEGAYAREYDTVDIEITCASGTYVRTIAHGLGISLAVPALALSITRTAVGPYELRDVS